MEKNKFSLIDDKGNEVVYDVLFTFESEETNKSYIVYTDNSRDDKGNVQVYASTYNPELLKLKKNGKLLRLYLILYKKRLEKKQKIINTMWRK